MEKAREFQKNIYFCFIDYAKAFDCVDHKKLWNASLEVRHGGAKMVCVSWGQRTGVGTRLLCKLTTQTTCPTCLERKEGASGGQGGRGSVQEQLCLCWVKVTLPDAFLSDWE